MSETPLTLVLGILERRGYGPIIKTGNEHRCRCPAHNDKKPSLDVSEKNERVVLQCRSQHCSYQSIMQALGLKESDGFPANGRGQNLSISDRIIAAYDYRDEEARLLFQAVRLYPKDFRQRRPDERYAEGLNWHWNLNGVRIVPYRLPDLLRASSGSHVFVTEGEKDCDALAAIGLIATTNPMGAGKWKKLDSKTFEGFRNHTVIVIPDNDEAGRKHAEDVVQSLRMMAAEIAILTLPGLPEKGDVSDWLAAGGSAKALLQLAKQAPRIGDAWEGSGGSSTALERKEPAKETYAFQPASSHFAACPARPPVVDLGWFPEAGRRYASIRALESRQDYADFSIASRTSAGRRVSRIADSKSARLLRDRRESRRLG